MAKSGPRTVRRYTDHFKRTAVKLSRLDGVAVSDVAESLYIHPYMLSRWRKEANDGVLVMKGKDINLDKDTSSELKELRKIKRDYERLKVEHDLLKKAIQFTSAPNRTSSPSSTSTKKHTP